MKICINIKVQSKVLLDLKYILTPANTPLLQFKMQF